MRIIPLLLLFIAACDGGSDTYRATDRDNIEFVRLKQNVRYFNQVYPKGQVFDLIQTAEGKQIVLFRKIDISMIAGGAAGVLAIPMANQQRVVVDLSLCTTGAFALVSGAGSPKEGQGIFVIDGTLANPHHSIKDNPHFCIARL